MAGGEDLIDQIYEAAFVPELWPTLLERIGALVDCPCGALLTLGPGQPSFVTTPPYADVYRRYIASPKARNNIRPLRARERQHHGFLSDLDLCTREELEVDGIYQEFLIPAGLSWTVGTLIPVPGGDHVIFDLVCKAGRPPFEREDIARLDALRPHLARAGMVAARLGLEHARAMANALASAGFPAAVLTGSHRVIAANGLMEALSDRIAIGARDRLLVADPRANRLLQRELERAASGVQPVVRSIPVPANAAGGPALVLHLVPIRRAAHDLFQTGQLMLIVTPVTPGSGPSSEVIKGLFDLTATEARVARRLLEGAAAAEIAAESGTSLNTIRFHIKSLLAKTGHSRQVDLVTLLAGLSLPAGG